MELLPHAPPEGRASRAMHLSGKSRDAMPNLSREGTSPAKMEQAPSVSISAFERKSIVYTKTPAPTTSNPCARRSCG